MKTLDVSRILGLVSILCMATVVEAAPKKITVQGVIRRAGATGTDALINTTPTVPNAVVGLRCVGAGCDGGATQNYTTGSGLLAADDTVLVRNGAFTVSLQPSDTTLQLMLAHKAESWYVVITGTLDDFSPSSEFVIPIESVPFAYIADYAGEAHNAATISGASVDVTGWATGKLLKFDASGNLVVGDDNDSGGGGGGGGVTSFVAGTGIALSGATISVDVGTSMNQIPQLGTGGKLATALLDVGVTANQIPQLDSGGRLLYSMIPNLTGVSAFVQLTAGKIPSGLIDSTSIATDTINGGTHIADNTITGLKMVTGAIDTLQIKDGAVTDAKVASGIDAMKLSGSASLTGVTADGVTIKNQGLLRLSEDSGSGTNFIALRAPATLAADLTWTLPSVAGSNGDVLKFDSSTSTFYFDADAGASGGISGPGAAVTANSISRWNGTGGTTVKGSGAVIDDSDNITGVNKLTGATLNVSGLTASKLVFTDGSKNLISSASAVTDTELGYLVGATAAIQTQINTLSAGGSATGKVDKTGDSMSGALEVGATITSTGLISGLNLNASSATATRFAMFDGSKNLVSSTNAVTDAEFGRLSGVSANIQTQINSLLSGGSAANKVDKAGDSMSGALEVGAAITSTGTVTAATLNGTGLTANRALATDGSKNLVTSSVTDTELGYLSGVTSNVGAKLNLLTVSDIGYLTGATANVQTQINTLSAASGVSKTGDSMSGALNVGAAITSTTTITGATVNVTSSTGDRVLVTDSSKNLTSSAVTATELGYLAGVTANLAPNLNGLTANVQTQINALASGSIANDAVTSAMLKNDTAASEAVSFDVLRTTSGAGESDPANTQRVIADRVYGTGSTEGTDKITLPAIVRIPLSVAHTDCGVVDNGASDMVVCAGF